MTQDPDPNDVRDESELTRRDAMKTGGSAGLATLLPKSVRDLAGGPESDAMSQHRVPYYRVPESDLDTPGVVGRRVEITSGGSTYSAGDQLVDTGSSWELVSGNFDSVSTEVTESDEVNGRIFASETIDSLPSVHSALDDAVAASGKQEVVICGGGEQIISDYSGILADVTIRGFDDAVVLKADDSVAGSGNPLLTAESDSDNFSIKDLYIDFNGAGGVVARGDGFKFKNCIFENCRPNDDNSSFGILDLSSANRAEIIECEFLECNGRGIDAGGSLDVTVEGCLFDGLEGGKVLAVGQTDFFKFVHNHVEGESSGTGYTEGITINSTMETGTIANNTFTGTDGWAIEVSPYDANISNNTIQTSNGQGIHIKGGRDSSINGNVIENCNGHGMLIELENAPSAYDGLNDAAKHSIGNNCVTGCDKAGIIGRGVQSLSLNGNEVHQNSREGADTWSGIQFESITIDSTTYESVNNAVVSNCCTDPRSTPTQKYGIETKDNSDHNLIRNNQCPYNSTGGVSTAGSASDSDVGNNLTSSP